MSLASNGKIHAGRITADNRPIVAEWSPPMSLSTAGDNAFYRLLSIAAGDTHQSAHVRKFVFAWWNAGELGGFDLTILTHVDDRIGKDMLTVMTELQASKVGCFYPEEHRDRIVKLIEELHGIP